MFKEARARAEARKAQAATSGGDEQVERMPLIAVLRFHWKDVLIAMGARMAENISFYVITAFILVYATTELKLSQQTALNAVLIASAVHFAVIPAWGALSDVSDAARCICSVLWASALWVFPFFQLWTPRASVRSCSR